MMLLLLRLLGEIRPKLRRCMVYYVRTLTYDCNIVRLSLAIATKWNLFV